MSLLREPERVCPDTPAMTRKVVVEAYDKQEGILGRCDSKSTFPSLLAFSCPSITLNLFGSS